VLNKKVNVALIGCGRIAGHHAFSIQSCIGVTLVAVCDLVSKKGESYREEFSVPCYKDYRVMFDAHPEIDTVAIMTPSGMHFEHGMEVMGVYGKSLIIEKPTFMRPDQLITAYDKAQELGLQIFPVFQNRYNLAVQRVKQAILNDELGNIQIVSVRTRWCRPQRYYDLAPWRGTFSHDGGALTNQGIHHVDLLRYLGGAVGQINATMRTLGADIEVEDTVVATFKYENNSLGNLEVTTAARRDDFEASLSIVGSKGLAQIGGIAVNELEVFTPNPEDCKEFSEDFSSCVYGNGHLKMYDDIVSTFLSGVSFPVTREDALSTIRLLHAFYRSDEAGGWVDVGSDEQSIRLGRQGEELSNLYRTSVS